MAEHILMMEDKTVTILIGGIGFPRTAVLRPLTDLGKETKPLPLPPPVRQLFPRMTPGEIGAQDVAKIKFQLGKLLRGIMLGTTTTSRPGK